MKRSGWQRCIRKDYVAEDCTLGNVHGRKSLMIFRELTAPLTIHYDFGDIKIADTGYAWLQIALENQFVWLTAMYDADGNLIQLYFDITAGNAFQDPENPCFTDMYLDVVVTAGGEIHVLDQDELDDALACGVISQAESAHAESVCRELTAYLKDNKENVIALCSNLLRELKQS